MTQYSFKRHQRLLTPSDFQAVFDGVDHRVSHKAYLILARQTDPSQPGRIGFVVSKKNLKFAVQRNRFKRQVRNSFRLNQQNLQGLDIIVLARPGTPKLDTKLLPKELEKGWQKLLSRCHNADPNRKQNSGVAEWNRLLWVYYGFIATPLAHWCPPIVVSSPHVPATPSKQYNTMALLAVAC